MNDQAFSDTQRRTSFGATADARRAARASRGKGNSIAQPPTQRYAHCEPTNDANPEHSVVGVLWRTDCVRRNSDDDIAIFIRDHGMSYVDSPISMTGFIQPIVDRLANVIPTLPRLTRQLHGRINYDTHISFVQFCLRL